MVDVLISCMALAKLPDLDWPSEPGFIQWAGAATGGHPDWSKPADQLREGKWRQGRLLPRLLKRFGMAADARVAAVGFSAGSNSGLRELMRNAEDRAQIDSVFAVDGFHPMRHPRPKSSAPRDQFAAYDQQIGFLADYAASAAHGGKMYVQTSSLVATPNPGVFATWEAMPLLYQLAMDQVPPRMQAPPNLPASFPGRTTSHKLKDGEPYPLPRATKGNADFLQLYYDGAGPRAHKLQAWVVAPDLIRELLLPRWKRGQA